MEDTLDRAGDEARNYGSGDLGLSNDGMSVVQPPMSEAAKLIEEGRYPFSQRLIASVRPHQHLTEAECKRYAKLFASAPVMLETLKVVLRYLNDTASDCRECSFDFLADGFDKVAGAVESMIKSVEKGTTE